MLVCMCESLFARAWKESNFVAVSGLQLPLRHFVQKDGDAPQTSKIVKLAEEPVFLSLGNM